MTDITNYDADDVFGGMINEIEGVQIGEHTSEKKEKSIKDLPLKEYRIIKKRKESIEIKGKDIFAEIFLKIFIQFIILFLFFFLYKNVDFFYTFFNNYYLIHYIFYIGIILLFLEATFFIIKLFLDIDVILYKYIRVNIEENEVIKKLTEEEKRKANILQEG